MKRRKLFILVGAAALAIAIYFATTRKPKELVLTGIVTTDSVIVSPEIQGRLQELLVNQGDTVTNGQLLAVLQPQEWKAEMAFYANSASQSAAQLTEAEADLKYQEAGTSNQIRQAEANLAASRAQVTQAKADLELANLNLQRVEGLFKKGVETEQTYDQMRTTKDATKARVDSLQKQVEAARAAVALARANEEQVAARKAAVQASRHQMDAATAQKERAQVRLDYTQVHAPVNGIVDVRAALQGEVVNPGQAIVTLIDPDNLWVRADVEETYIDRVTLGEKMSVRFPSGTVREGTVFYRGVVADYATQRDVSRTKRDIKTFEIRLRCDNRDRTMAVGMTAYVLFPLKPPGGA